MSGYKIVDSYTLLRERADKALSAKLIRRVGEFPRGPAGKAVMLTHMRNSGFTDEEIKQANDILSKAGIK